MARGDWAAIVRLSACLLPWALACARGPKPFVVASKPSTESEILGELAAILLEERLNIPVHRKFRLTGAQCADGVKSGSIDAYAEYTGSALNTLLRETPAADPAQAYERVSSEFGKRWGVRWLPPLGFNNAYTLVIRRTHAEKLGSSRLSDLRGLKKRLRCGFEFEFGDRPDGYKGLLRHYGMELCSSVTQMPPGAVYQALSDGHVDAVNGYTTDGRLAGTDLAPLEDDQGFFIPYDAALVLSASAPRRFPRAEETLRQLSGRITDKKMMRLNAAVDLRKKSAREAALEFLKGEGLLP